MKKVYNSKIDWWIWAVLLFAVVVVIVAGIGSPVWLTATLAAATGGIVLFTIFNCRYAIDGDELLVYTFGRPKRYPVGRIKEIKYCTSMLSAPALSSRRLAIRFTDRSIMRTYRPLEISPLDRDTFVKELLKINPSISVTR